jgi:hypothetical protein
MKGKMHINWNYTVIHNVKQPDDDPYSGSKHVMGQESTTKRIKLVILMALLNKQLSG